MALLEKNKIISFTSDNESFHFGMPFRWLLLGNSHCGKSSLIIKMLQNKHKFLPKHYKFQKVAYIYPKFGLSDTRNDQIKKLTDIFPNMIVIDEIPSLEEISKFGPKALIIFEDIFHHMSCTPTIMELFTTISHNADISVIFSCQNLFNNGKFTKTIQRQTTDIMVFATKSDSGWINTLSKQIFNNFHFLSDCLKFIKNCEKIPKYEKFLWLDLHTNLETPEEIAVRADIFNQNPLIFSLK